jgi:hypothetical protein
VIMRRSFLLRFKFPDERASREFPAKPFFQGRPGRASKPVDHPTKGADR